MPSIPTTPITEPVLLLAEGKQDARFFQALAKHIGLKNIQIEEGGGIYQLPQALKALKNRSGFANVTSLGIARDAETNANAAFRSVCGALETMKLPIPDMPLKAASGVPRVTIMILPLGDGNTSGILEDVCLSSVEDTPVMECVNAYFECLRTDNVTLSHEMSKAKIQVYLSAQYPELRLGEAAERDVWNWENPAFQVLISFLRQVAATG